MGPPHLLLLSNHAPLVLPLPRTLVRASGYYSYSPVRFKSLFLGQQTTVLHSQITILTAAVRSHATGAAAGVGGVREAGVVNDVGPALASCFAARHHELIFPLALLAVFLLPFPDPPCLHSFSRSSQALIAGEEAPSPSSQPQSTATLTQPRFSWPR